MEKGIGKLVEELSDLSAADMKELGMRLQHLGALKEGSSDNDSELELFHGCVALSIKQSMKKPLAPIPVLRGTSPQTIAILRKANRSLDAFLLEVVKSGSREIDKRKRQRWYLLYLRLTIKAIKSSKNAPLTLRTILLWAERFPAVLEAAFPGYLAAGVVDSLLLSGRVAGKSLPTAR